MENKKLVPELRFEFSSNWKSKKLKDIIQISKEKYNPDSDRTNYKCIELEHLAQETGLLLGYTDSINQNSIKNKFHEDNILFGKLRPYLKKFYYTNFVGVCSSEIWVFDTNEYSKYIYYLIQTKKFLDISNVSSGSKMPRSDWNFMKDFVFIIPDIKTQKEIANLFSMIDNKIELLENKYQQYQNFKKYLMQQIFTQKLRFADIDSDWKEISLKDIGTFYRGHSYNSSNVVDEGLLVLRSNNIQNNVLDFSEDRLQFVDKDCKKELELQKNDIVICMSNGTRKLVGKSAEYTGNYANKLTVGAFCSIFRTENKLAKYLFQTESYKKNLYLILAGTNINNLKNSDLEKFKFNIPTNESEINKIHDLFVSIDNKIDYNKKQLEEITLFKKALLQQMFV